MGKKEEEEGMPLAYVLSDQNLILQSQKKAEVSREKWLKTQRDDQNKKEANGLVLPFPDTIDHSFPLLMPSFTAKCTKLVGPDVNDFCLS
jgi:hypothetical protein